MYLKKNMITITFDYFENCILLQIITITDYDYPRSASWADQLLPQLLMKQFDTLPIQCRHIEHMHEGVWFRKNDF